MNDYFDLDLYYGTLKVSIKSSYFRVKERLSFVVYGDKGCFIKANKDRQEEHLKLFYLLGSPGFGIDRIEDYGILSYYDDGVIIMKKKLYLKLEIMEMFLMNYMRQLFRIKNQGLRMNKRYYKWKF